MPYYPTATSWGETSSKDRNGQSRSLSSPGPQRRQVPTKDPPLATKGMRGRPAWPSGAYRPLGNTLDMTVIWRTEPKLASVELAEEHHCLGAAGVSQSCKILSLLACLLARLLDRPLTLPPVPLFLSHCRPATAGGAMTLRGWWAGPARSSRVTERRGYCREASDRNGTALRIEGPGQCQCQCRSCHSCHCHKLLDPSPSPFPTSNEAASPLLRGQR